MMFIYDAPPAIILPDHYQESRPAIIMPGRELIEAAIPVGMFSPRAPLEFTQVIVGQQSNGITAATRLAGSQAGDVMIIIGCGDQGSAVPFGSTQIRFYGTTVRGWVWVKIMTGAEVSGANLSNSGVVYGVGIWRPSIPVLSIVDNNTGNGESTSGNPASQTITASAATTACILFGLMKGTSTVVDSVSPAMDRYAVSGTAWEVMHFKLYNTSPVNHTYDMPDEGNNVMTSGYLTFTT